MDQGHGAAGRDAWLLLNRAPGIGAITFRRLLQTFGTPQRVFEAGHAGLSQFDLRPETLRFLADPDLKSIEPDLVWLDAPRRELLTLADPRYPRRLCEIADPPPLLFVHGHVELLNSPQIAVVGSRSPSRGGGDNAHEFAKCLVEHGFTITSGLALGVDAGSHRGAIAATGATVAVLGTGPDRIYPAQHHELAAAIVERGALVTEFPVQTPVRPENFPRRNRIISGMSLGVLVVEAARASGSLITARHALEQGREVFAIPGSIHNPMARGCHALIREGAKLVESVDDILEELPPMPAVSRPDDAQPAAEVRSRERDDLYRRLLDALGHDPVAVDTLVARTGLTANAVSSMLLIMELEGQVCSQAGGLYVRHRPR